jgi:DNA sulfur modification protein DndB
MPIDRNFAHSLPAAQGQQFKPFYSINFPAEVLVNLLRIDNKGSVLKRSQREVNMKRAQAFCDYLMENHKRFYIVPTVLGVVSAKRGMKPEFEPMAKGAKVGYLHISMCNTIKLFDGQHRMSGISLGLELFIDKLEEMGFDLAKVDIPMMLFTDLTLKERQLGFTDVNANLSKPMASITDAYNSRDPLPLLARHLAENCLPFKGLVDFERNTIAKNSDKYFPLKALKDVNQVLLGLKSTVKEIPDAQRDLANDFWINVSRAMGWGGLEFNDDSPELIRSKYIWTHVAMLKALAVAGKEAMEATGGLDTVQWSKLEELNYSRDKDESDFTGRIIDPITGNMIINKSGVNLAANVLLKTLGIELSEERQALENQYFPQEVSEEEVAQAA